MNVSGLDGVVAGETAVSTLSDGLQYRGFAIEELVAEATFPEVAWLLLYGELPTGEELADFRAILAEESEVPEPVIALLHELPLHVAPIDALRTAVSMLAHFDVQGAENTDAADRGKAIRLMGQIPVLLAVRHRLVCGLEPVESDAELSFASNFLWLLTGEIPSPAAERAFEQALICYADHEFNASTFTARVVASTGSDLYSAVTAAIGALKGPAHGGANEQVVSQLLKLKTAEQGTEFVRSAIAKKSRIFGFGHRVYRNRPDPRAVLLKEICQQLATTRELKRIEQVADAVEQTMWNEKRLRPNVDWPAARLFHAIGLDESLFTSLFAAARVIGWSAHFMEQRATGILIQPRANYCGPAARPYVPLNERFD